MDTTTLRREAAANTWPLQFGREEFAMRALKVRKIMKIQDITAVPHTPVYVKGVINLRGKVAPVVDLRQKFGLPERQHTERTGIVVVQRQGEPGIDGAPTSETERRRPVCRVWPR